jgi:hypothetical protein
MLRALFIKTKKFIFEKEREREEKKRKEKRRKEKEKEKHSPMEVISKVYTTYSAPNQPHLSPPGTGLQLL